MLTNTDVMGLLKVLGQEGERRLCLKFAMFCANYPEVEGLNSSQLRSISNDAEGAVQHALLALTSTNVEHVSLHTFYAYQAASLAGVSGLEEKLAKLLLGEKA